VSARISISVENGKLFLSYPSPYFTSSTSKKTEFFSLEMGDEFKFSDDYKTLSFGAMNAIRHQIDTGNDNSFTMRIS